MMSTMILMTKKDMKNTVKTKIKFKKNRADKIQSPNQASTNKLHQTR